MSENCIDLIATALRGLLLFLKIGIKDRAARAKHVADIHSNIEAKKDLLFDGPLQTNLLARCNLTEQFSSYFEGAE